MTENRTAPKLPMRTEATMIRTFIKRKRSATSLVRRRIKGFADKTTRKELKKELKDLRLRKKIIKLRESIKKTYIQPNIHRRVAIPARQIVIQNRQPSINESVNSFARSIR